MFEKLELTNWRQFEKIDIDFHKNLTIITGINGTGKTTILNLLSRYLGWTIPFSSTPKIDEKEGVLKYYNDLWIWKENLITFRVQLKGDTNAVLKICKEILEKNDVIFCQITSVPTALASDNQHDIICDCDKALLKLMKWQELPKANDPNFMVGIHHLLEMLNKDFSEECKLQYPDKDKDYQWVSCIEPMHSDYNSFIERQKKAKQLTIGSIQIKNRSITIEIPVICDRAYHISKDETLVKGIHIPSHNSTPISQGLKFIPTKPQSGIEVFHTYVSLTKNRYMSSNYTQDKTPHDIIKESLLSLAIYGYGNKVIIPYKKAQELFENFEKILESVLPPQLGFIEISIRPPEIVLVTKSGEFSIDAISGGLNSIITLMWQIFMFSSNEENFVVTIDEPENHLHPEMQMSLLPNFIKVFPNVQFIVATHSPLIVSSVADSNVYILNYEKITNKVVSVPLKNLNKAGSSNDILKEALGLSFTMPLWAEKRLQEILEKYVTSEINEESLYSLRNELKELGMDKWIPDTIAKVFEMKAEAKKNDSVNKNK